MSKISVVRAGAVGTATAQDFGLLSISGSSFIVPALTNRLLVLLDNGL
jgi:hypothetical protein